MPELSTVERIADLLSGLGYYATSRQIAEEVGISKHFAVKALNELVADGKVNRAACADAVRWGWVKGI